VKLTELEAKIYNSLLDNYEGAEVNGWALVYLDNARPSNINARQFAAILSSLQQKGLYQSRGDNFFGDVFIRAAA
jgi:hypothetical protein